MELTEHFNVYINLNIILAQKGLYVAALLVHEGDDGVLTPHTKLFQLEDREVLPNDVLEFLYMIIYGTNQVTDEIRESHTTLLKEALIEANQSFDKANSEGYV